MIIHTVILAGGNGKRLWPLSNQESPKQLLAFLGSSTLLDQTIDRLEALIPKTNCSIITQAQYHDRVMQHCGHRVAHVLAEPCGRNTAPALALFLQQAEALGLAPETIIAVLPADHFIPDKQLFIATLEQAATYASTHNVFVLLGITPSYAATGYGYIQTEATQSLSTQSLPETPLHVVRFHEKPTYERAQEYISQSSTFWNSGIVISRLDFLRQEYKRLQPTLYARVEHAHLDPHLYQQLPDSSLDYALLEKSSNTVLFPFVGAWYDVGNLDTLLTLENMYGPQKNNLYQSHGENNLCSSHKQVVCLGVSNLRIIETETTLLICAQDNVEHVKNITQAILKNKPLKEDA